MTRARRWCTTRFPPATEFLHGLSKDLQCRDWNLLVDQLARVLPDDLAQFDAVHDHLWWHVPRCRRDDCGRCHRRITDKDIISIRSRVRRQPTGLHWPPRGMPRL